MQTQLLIVIVAEKKH